MSGPRVAVIIPCHNDGPFVLEAVESVRSEPDVELVVIDDCSTDAETISILDSLGTDVRLVRHEVNRGLAAARNSGVEASSAALVFPLDADDLAVSGSLARMADRIESDTDAVACYGDYLEFGRSNVLRHTPPRLDAFRLAYRNEYPVTALFRRQALADVGGWKPVGQRAGYEDWHLWMTFAGAGSRAIHAGPGVVTYRRRIHGHSMLADVRTVHRDTYRSLRAEHPEIFSRVPDHRRASDLGWVGKLTYPVLFGGRPRSKVERAARRWVERIRGAAGSQ